MASLGHIAVGMAASRLYRDQRPSPRLSLSSALFWSALSFLPDADVVGFALGVRYADEWGHRGATHSFVFAMAVGAIVGIAAPFVRRAALRTGVLATLVLASHPLLDTLTDGGLGCALFWPVDLTRYFAPWTPIPVSPIGLRFFSPYGMYTAGVELLYFAPLIWFAWRPRIRPIIPLVVWLVAMWLLVSSDPVRERVIRFVLRDDTVFAPGFSEGSLNAVERGDSYDDVRRRLGTPLREFLHHDRLDTCGVVFLEGDVLSLNAGGATLCRYSRVQEAGMMGRISGCVVLCGLIAGSSLQAHHSLAGVYDMRKEGEMKGAFVSIKLTNPHGSLTLAVKSPDGSNTDWVMTTGSATTLAERGITKSNTGLKVGDEISVKFFPARNGSPLGFLKSVTLADGRTLMISAGNAAD
jgi:inner membrane protein